MNTISATLDHNHKVNRRSLLSSSKEVLVVGGNFTFKGESVTLLQWDLVKEEWAKAPGPELFLYGSESVGVVYDLVVDKSHENNQIYVVGEFDTIYSTSQIAYCSIGNWDGNDFFKVGEGLCPRGGDGSESMHVHAAALSGNGDLFVGGPFESRVWNGKQFVTVKNLGRFNGRWLPLDGELGPIGCHSCNVDITALYWDEMQQVLFIGGSFNLIGDSPSTPGLAVWTQEDGLLPFPGGGLYYNDKGGTVSALYYDKSSSSLFVVGEFNHVNDTKCTGIAVWYSIANRWKCFYDKSYGLKSITTLLLSNNILYLAGDALGLATGINNKNRYNIIWADIGPYISSHKSLHPIHPHPSNSSNSNNHNSNSNDNENSNGLDSSTTTYNNIINTDNRFSRRFKREMNHLDDNSSGNNDNYYDYKGSVLGTVINPRESFYSNHNYSTHRHAYSGETLTKKSSSSSNSSSNINMNNTRYRSRNLKKSMSSRSSGYSNLIDYSQQRRRLVDGRSISSFFRRRGSAPNVTQWKPAWDWLDGFNGVNSPIAQITPGKRGFSSVLFIAGGFNGSILQWSLDKSGGIAKPVGISGNIQGLVTSIRQAQMHMQSNDPDENAENTIDNVPINYAWLILISCLLSGIVLGIVFAIGCNTSLPYSYLRIPDKDDSSSGLSLTTLSGPAGDVDHIDFLKCFERAMKARHLTNHETLMVINPKEIVLQSVIGEGSFGRVWSGNWRSNQVAVKEFVFAQAVVAGGSIQRKNIVEEIVGEAGIMACLRHPKILQLYGCSLTMQAIWIVNELCERGSMRMVLNDKSLNLSLMAKTSLCLDIADAMLYLHTRSPPIIHRDLKSHNVFVIEPTPGHFVAKIGDWGSARAVALTTGIGPKSMTYGVGTACWLAPEVILSAHSSKASDVYAFGVLLWEVYTRSEVYEGLSAAQIIAKVANEGLRPQAPLECPWADQMTDCWKQEPDQRPSFSYIMTHLSKIYSNLKQANKAKKNNSTTDGESSTLYVSDANSSLTNSAIGSDSYGSTTSPRSDSNSVNASNNDSNRDNNRSNKGSGSLFDRMAIWRDKSNSGGNRPLT